MKTTKDQIFLWFLIFIAPSLLLISMLLRPWLWLGMELKIPNGSEPFITVNPPPNYLLPKLVKALYGSSLTLDNLEVCLKNKNLILNSEVVYLLPSKKDPEAGAMEIKFQYTDNTEQALYVPVNTEKCSIFPLKTINHAYVTRRGFADPTTNTFVQSDNSIISYHIITSELLAKIIIFVVGWLVFMVNFITSIKFVFEKTKVQSK